MGVEGTFLKRPDQIGTRTVEELKRAENEKKTVAVLGKTASKQL